MCFLSRILINCVQSLRIQMIVKNALKTICPYIYVIQYCNNMFKCSYRDDQISNKDKIFNSLCIFRLKEIILISQSIFFLSIIRCSFLFSHNVFEVFELVEINALFVWGNIHQKSLKMFNIFKKIKWKKYYVLISYSLISKIILLKFFKSYSS